MRPLSTLICLAAAAGPLFARQDPPQPGAVAALHRSGQTFLTFEERPELSGESYRIYRHGAPISAANLNQADFCWELWEDSSRFSADRYYASGQGIWTTRYHERFPIVDGGPELGANTGLLVWTLHPEDFGLGTAGSAWYAVTTVSSAGIENRVDFGAGNSIGPVAESLGLPEPVRGTTVGGGLYEIYTQYMDLREWNPTFNAPNAHNSWYGLAAPDPSVAQAVQYAYTYAVLPPYAGPCKSPAGKRPLLVSLHGHGGNKVRPKVGDPKAIWCEAYRISPIDINDTWWFGFARDHDYRVDLDVQAGDTIVNYTEQRVLRMVDDLLRHPVHGPNIDPERIYIEGHSMGGSGALAFALRYPELFAAAYASKGMTDYEHSGDFGGQDWKPDVIVKWGDPALDLPIQSLALEGLADHLAAYDGTSVWDWQDHQENVLARVADEVAPFGVIHSMDDALIEWGSQGLPLYAPIDAARRAWAGRVTMDGHAGGDFAGSPPTIAPDLAGVPFAGWSVVLSETVPGLSASSADPPLPPATTGSYLENVEWSASWNPWDGAPQDSANLWSLSLRTTATSPLSLDVTPRRTQAFAVAPGQAFAWERREAGGSAALEVGAVTADADGLLTVPQVELDSRGCRLLIRPASAVPDLLAAPAGVSISTGGEHHLALLAGPAHAGRIYLLLGSASGTSPGTPIGLAVLPLIVDDYTVYALSVALSPEFDGFFGLLDGAGVGNATLTLPGGLQPSLAGRVLHHAYLVFDPAITAIHASQPTSLTLLP